MPTIYMIGDSIMQTNKYNTYPQTGWGQILPLFVNDNINVVNLAKNGTSSKSFFDQHRFDEVEKNIKQGDLLIVGFAHNDEKIQDPLRYTSPFDTFLNYLKYYIDVAKSKGAYVVLTTPVIRRKYENGKIVNTHGDYISAIKKCSEINNVPYCDLNKKTTDFYNKLSEIESKRYFMNFGPALYDNYPLGQHDDSHQRVDGAFMIAKFFVEEVYDKDLKFKNYFIEVLKPDYKAEDTIEK